MVFPNIDPVAVQLGPLVVRWYALAYVAGIVVGFSYIGWLNARVARMQGRAPFFTAIDFRGQCAAGRGTDQVWGPGFASPGAMVRRNGVAGGRLRPAGDQGFR